MTDELSLGFQLLGYALGVIAELVGEDPTIDVGLVPVCCWCGQPARIPQWFVDGKPWRPIVLVHDDECAWVKALRFLGRNRPAGHEVSTSPGEASTSGG